MNVDIYLHEGYVAPNDVILYDPTIPTPPSTTAMENLPFERHRGRR